VNDAFRALVAVLIGVIFSLWGDVYLKRAEHLDLNFCKALGVYLVACFPLWLSYRFAEFTSIAILWQAGMVACSIVIGIVLFKERIGPWKVASLVFLGIALCLTVLDCDKSDDGRLVYYCGCLLL
jgi:drug/metabolite transporter (DMT)-like permease